MTDALPVLLLLVSFFSAAPAVAVEPAGPAPADDQTLAFVGGRVYISPTQPPLVDAVVLVVGSRIAQVGGRGSVQPPANARIIDCRGMTLTAGFWNSHVHFIEPKWKDADTLPPQVLTAQLQEMLTRYGFVRAFETAAFDRNITFALRRRIETGDVAGPAIYTVGVPFTPPDGYPVYLAPFRITLPEFANKQEAERLVRAEIAAGADGIKFWTVSPLGGSQVATMPPDIARHAIGVAHSLGKPVFAHPTNLTGVRIAAQTGVDVLAHTSSDDFAPWDEGLVRTLKAANTALIPTLKLWHWEAARQGATPEVRDRLIGTTLQQLRLYSTAGGTILFGTDVGYVTDYDPALEYQLMHKAGLTFQQILASLTTAPAAKFGQAHRTGTIAPGMDADLVVLTKDPATGVEAFTAVRSAFAQGRQVYGPDTQ